MTLPLTPSTTLPVTALVPTFRRPAMLGEALGSILATPRPPAQVLVIDDGSGDETEHVVKGYGGRVEYVAQENAGKSVALNRGLALAREPYVWIFDDDDIATPHGIGALHDALERRPEAGFAYGLLDQFDGAWPAPVTEPLECYRASDRASLYVKLCQDFFLWQGASLVRRSAFETVGPFDERFTRSQDYQMALRLLRAFPAVAVPTVVFHQRQHAGDRGPRHASVKARDVEKAWTRFNHLMFTEAHASHALDEFVVASASGPLVDRDRATALLQRGAIMARKGLWDLAGPDMQAAGSIMHRLGVTTLAAQETAALRVVFEHGARSWFASTAEAVAFARATRAFGPALGREVRGNLLLPITHRARHWAGRPDRAAEARQIARVAFAFGRWGAVEPYMRARRTPMVGYGIERVTPLASSRAGTDRPTGAATVTRAATSTNRNVPSV